MSTINSRLWIITGVLVCLAFFVLSCSGVEEPAVEPAAESTVEPTVMPTDETAEEDAEGELAEEAKIEDEPSDDAGTAHCDADGTVLNINCPALPNTPSMPEKNHGPHYSYDTFAWNSFIALNWSAIDPETHNYQRGFPDVSKPFTATQHNDLVVWETYKEKREIFPPVGSTAVPDAWNSKPNYNLDGQDVPFCSNVSEEEKTKMVDRFFAQGSKLVYDTLDETIEVASEALETQAQLCGGYIEPDQVENMCDGSESEPLCCKVPHQVVGPRVWKGQPAQGGRPVLYEVKLNYDFFNYVDTHKYYSDDIATSAAQVKNITLPWRTNAGEAPGRSQNPGVTNYDAQACVTDYYTKVISDPGGDHKPCLTGAIQTKSAWLMLDDSEDHTQYHTADAYYYKTEKDSNNKEITCKQPATFGLIGLHIIQRIHTGTSGSDNFGPQGGTFIFATWEHVGNDAAGFTYANYLVNNSETITTQSFPAITHTLPLTRRYPISTGTQTVNTRVHEALGCPGSVWCNYQLIGTQFHADNAVETFTSLPLPKSNNDPSDYGQAFYLANLVIESNVGLQQFQGLPPETIPIGDFKTTKNTNDTTNFDRSADNLNFNVNQGGNSYNMGGCMGCHGVAQLKGYSFSFVLLNGQRGSTTDTQTNFEVPPQPLPAAIPKP
ncbi:MAG: hypothetical protein AAF639_03375 [Chloroflexota bacterium]